MIRALEISRYGETIDIHFATDSDREQVKERLSVFIPDFITSMVSFPGQLSFTLNTVVSAKSLYDLLCSRFQIQVKA